MADKYLKTLDLGNGDKYHMLPLVTSENDGMILRVTNGEWGAGYAIPDPWKGITWANGTDEQIVAMLNAHDAGEINIHDYWHVGDERKIQLSAMAATGVGESHVAQEATLVLMDSTCTGFTLATTTSGGKTKPDFIVGLKNCLKEIGYMNSSNTNLNGWSGCARRTWCNDVFRPSIPSSLRGIFKQFKWKQGIRNNMTANGIIETTDYFGLAPEKAIVGGRSYSFADEAELYAQWDWYKTSANRIKKLGDADSAYNYNWWECSPHSGNSINFCFVNIGGNASNNYASDTNGLAPFGCIAGGNNEEVWRFNDNVMGTSASYDVNFDFTSNGEAFTGIRLQYQGKPSINKMFYKKSDSTEIYVYDMENVRRWESDTIKYQTITFKEGALDTSENMAFKNNWFVNNAVKQ